MANGDDDWLSRIVRLLTLRNPADRNAQIWIGEVRQVLVEYDLQDLAVTLPDRNDFLTASHFVEFGEPVVIAVIDSAVGRLEERLAPGLARYIRLASTHAAAQAKRATAATDRLARRQWADKFEKMVEDKAKASVEDHLTKNADAFILKSKTAEVVNWLFPKAAWLLFTGILFIAALVIGGSIFGRLEVKGLLAFVDQSREQIVTARDRAIGLVTADLKDETTKQKAALVDVFDSAKQEILKASGAGQKNAEETARTTWKSLEDNGAIEIDNRKRAILATFDSFRIEGRQRLDNLLAEMPEKISELAKKLENVKAESPKIERIVQTLPYVEKISKDLDRFVVGSDSDLVLWFYRWGIVIGATSILLSGAACGLSIWCLLRKP